MLKNWRFLSVCLQPARQQCFSREIYSIDCLSQIFKRKMLTLQLLNNFEKEWEIGRKGLARWWLSNRLVVTVCSCFCCRRGAWTSGHWAGWHRRYDCSFEESRLRILIPKRNVLIKLAISFVEIRSKPLLAFYEKSSLFELNDVAVHSMKRLTRTITCLSHLCN